MRHELNQVAARAENQNANFLKKSRKDDFYSLTKTKISVIVLSIQEFSVAENIIISNRIFFLTLCRNPVKSLELEILSSNGSTKFSEDRNKYLRINPRNSTAPIMCVQMLPVSA